MSRLFGLSEVLGATLIIVTHDRELAQSGDRILEVRDGKVLSHAAK